MQVKPAAWPYLHLAVLTPRCRDMKHSEVQNSQYGFTLWWAVGLQRGAKHGRILPPSTDTEQQQQPFGLVWIRAVNTSEQQPLGPPSSRVRRIGSSVGSSRKVYRPAGPGLLRRLRNHQHYPEAAADFATRAPLLSPTTSSPPPPPQSRETAVVEMHVHLCTEPLFATIMSVRGFVLCWMCYTSYRGSKFPASWPRAQAPKHAGDVKGASACSRHLTVHTKRLCRPLPLQVPRV